MRDNIKLVIEIPAETYEYWKTHKDEYVLAEAIQNGIPLDDVKAEITKKAFTEEIFDEDIFRSIYTESMTREEAEEESVIETEIVKLPDVLEILDNIGKAESEGDEKSTES